MQALPKSIRAHSSASGSCLAGFSPRPGQNQTFLHSQGQRGARGASAMPGHCRCQPAKEEQPRASLLFLIARWERERADVLGWLLLLPQPLLLRAEPTVPWSWCPQLPHARQALPATTGGKERLQTQIIKMQIRPRAPSRSAGQPLELKASGFVF